ncbi:MAG: AI-2E family transporter [Candidatus Paceibacterota bacterium]
MALNITKWDISWSVIFKILLVIILVYALFLIRSIIVIGLAALVVSIIFNPAISFFTKRKIPRAVAAVMVYAGFLAIAGFIIYIIFPPIITEAMHFSQNFSNDFSNYANKISSIIGINVFDLNNLLTSNPAVGDNLLNLSKGVFGFISSFVGGLMSVATMFVLAFFLSVEENELTKMIKSFSPKKWEEDILRAWGKSQEQVMGWFGSRLITSAAVAVMTFIVCFALHIKFAVSVSVLAGLLNLVPLIGPIVASILLVSLGLLNSWTIAVVVLILSIVIQLIENYLLTPLVAKQIIGIPNFLVLFSILIGAELLGVVGAVLAIPLFAVLYETVKNYITYKKNQA